MKFLQYGPNERSVGRRSPVGPQYILLLTLFSYTCTRRSARVLQTAVCVDIIIVYTLAVFAIR